MKAFRSKLMGGFTLVEIMIVVLIIGILLAIAIPNFVSARESSRAKACVGNLKQIDSASQQYAMDNKLQGTSSLPALATLCGTSGYIRVQPTCPEGGTENVATNVSGEPYCTISDGSSHGSQAGGLSTGDAADYGTAGKWYHGLSN